MDKRTVSVFLILFLLFLLTGCTRFASKQNQAGKQNQLEEKTGEQQNFYTAASSSAQQFIINVPEKTYEKNVRITGQVSPSYQLFVNNKELIISPEGTFDADIDLVPGINTLNFKVVSYDEASIYTTSRLVEYEQKPKLEIKQPSQIADRNITIEGVTDPDCEVSINGYKTNSDTNGSFKITILTLQQNETIKIISTNKAGKSTVIQRTIDTSSLAGTTQ